MNSLKKRTLPLLLVLFASTPCHNTYTNEEDYKGVAIFTCIVAVSYMLLPSKIYPEPQCLSINNKDYILKELDCSDHKEAEQVINIFKDSVIQELTAMDSIDIANLIETINTNSTVKSNVSMYICKETVSNSICGVILAYKSNSYKIFYKAIAVHHDYRRQNIASHLLSYAEKIALKSNGMIIELFVYKNNQPAIACYQKHGFIIRNDHDSTMTCYTMNKIL